MKQLASYSEEREAYILEKGLYNIYLGNNSIDTKCVGRIELDETVEIHKVKNVLGDPGFKDYKPEMKREEEDENAIQKTKVVPLFAAMFNTDEVEISASRVYHLIESLKG